MSTHILVKFSDNWAGEIDLAGFRFFTPQAWEDTKTTWKKTFLDGPVECYFGTHQFIKYEHYQDLMDRLTVEDITLDQYTTLSTLLPLHPRKSRYGHFPGF